MMVNTIAFALVKSPPQKAILPNGMRVIAVEDKSLPIVSAGLLFGYQATDQRFFDSGIGEIAVQLIRNADTESRSRFEINSDMEKAGLMPQFGSKLPVFYMGCQGPAENLLQILGVFKDVGFKLKPTKDDFRNAKGHARSKLNTRKAFPLHTGYLEDQLWKDLYGVNGCGVSKAYTKEKLEKVGFENYQNFASELFVPNNAVLVVVGNVNASSVFRDSMKLFGNFKASVKEHVNIAKSSEEKFSEKVKKEYLKINKTQVVVGFEAPAMGTSDTPATILWQAALSDINDSWLQFKFGREFPELSDLSAQYTPLRNNGLFVIRFSSSHPDVDRAISSLLAALGSLELASPKGRELKKLVNIKQLEFLEKKEVRLDRAFFLGFSELVKSYKIFDSISTSLQRVEHADMKRVARKIFGSNKYFLRIAYPLKYQKPSNKKVTYRELDNGVKIVVNNYSGSEIAGISFRFGMDACATDSKSKLISRMLSEFIKIHINENEKLSSGLDSIGAKLDAEANGDSLTITGKTQKKDLPELIRFIKKLIFAQHKKKKDKIAFERAKEKLLKLNEERKGNPEYTLFNEIEKRLFPGLEIFGYHFNEATVKQVTYREISEFYKKWAVGSNIQCAAVGNFSTEEIADLLEKEFKDLPKGNPQVRSECPAWLNKPLDKTVVEQIKVPAGLDHATIVVAYRMKNLTNLKNDKELRENFGVNSVLAHVLFSSQNSLIARELNKIDANLGVGGNVLSDERYSVFVIFAHVPFNKLDQSKKVIENVLASIPDLKISNADIQSSGKVLKTMFNMALQKSYSQAATMVQFLGAGLDHNYLPELLSVYDRVTIDDVKKGASQNFKNYLMLIAKPK